MIHHGDRILYFQEYYVTVFQKVKSFPITKGGKLAKLKKTCIWLVLLLFILSGCSKANNAKPDNLPDPKIIIKKVALIYGETNPKIIKIKEDTTDNNMKPMYLVTIKGNFKKGNLYAPYLSFSMLADGTYVWCIRAYNNLNSPVSIWEDNEIRFH